MNQVNNMELSEDAIQAQCYQFWHNSYPHLRGLLFSVPNGGLRNPREANKLKATGCYAGVSDLILLYNGTAYMLEAKIPKGTQSPAQKKWMETVVKQGYQYHIFRSLDEFKAIIVGLVGMPTTQAQPAVPDPDICQTCKHVVCRCYPF